MAGRGEIVCQAMIKGSPQWRSETISWVRVSLRDVRGSARPVAHHLADLRDVIEGDGDDWDTFVREDLACEPEFAQKIVEGVAFIERWKPKANPTIEQALAAPAAKQPGPPEGTRNNPAGRRGKEETNVRNTGISSGGHDTASTRVARLKRDAPQVVEDLKAGKHRSVNAAWKHAVQTGAVTIKPRVDPVHRTMDRLRKAVESMDDEEKRRLGKMLAVLFNDLVRQK